MFLSIHTVDCKTYCSLIYSPVPHVKQSTPVLSTLLTLVTKYYCLSNNLPPTKKKWFSHHINQFNTWNMVELQKWLKIAKRIIHNDNLKRKKTLKTTVSTTKFSRYIHQIIPVTDIQIIAKRKSTSITTFFFIKDNRQDNEFKETNKFRRKKFKNIQVKKV